MRIFQFLGRMTKVLQYQRSVAFRGTTLGYSHKLPMHQFVPANYSASNFTSRVASWLGVEIIGAAMDHNRSSNDIPHTKTVCPHSQICPSIAQHQGWKVSCVIGVRIIGRIIMPSSIGKALS